MLTESVSLQSHYFFLFTHLFTIFACVIEHEIYQETITEFLTVLLMKHSGNIRIAKILKQRRTEIYPSRWH